MTDRTSATACSGYRGADRRTRRCAYVPLSNVTVAGGVAVLLTAIVGSLVWVWAGSGTEAILPSGRPLPPVVVATATSVLALFACARAVSTGDARLSRLSLALFVFTAGALPVSLTGATAVVPGSLETASFAIAAVLTAGALTTPDVDTTRPMTRTVTWSICGLAGLGAVTVLAGSGVQTALRVGCLCLLTIAGAAVMAHAFRRRRAIMWLFGASLLAFTAAEFVEVAIGTAGHTMAGAAIPPLAAATLLLTVATVSYVHAGTRARRRGDSVILDRVWSAEAALRHEHEATAERDHEIRNLVTGLSGAAFSVTQLRDLLTGADIARLEHGMSTELAALQQLVNPETASSRPYDVGATLSDVIDVQRTTGQRISFSGGVHLVANGRPEALVQIVTNVLRNAAQHAPGAAVRVNATRTSGTITITIADDGPGLAPGEETAVVLRGVRGSRAATGGMGLGLHVSTRLAREEGGSLRIEHHKERRGCTVVLQLPVASGAGAFATFVRPDTQTA